MTRTKETFTTRPETPDRVQMYVCGVTVYDYSHIGHARVYTAFDVLYRLLAAGLGYDVQYVRNFTDVDDKIIARAADAGEDPLALAGRFIAEFHEDMRALGCLPPTLEPRATDFIPEMVATISRIIANGHAYAVEGGDVFFNVGSLPGYGALSGRVQEDNRAGERVAVDARKRGPADFALWKASKPGEPSWPSPWGPGRPGWHIECSSMIEKVMGPLIDIHGGGRDLVFPHHENELAQSRAAVGPCHAHGHAHAEGGDCCEQGAQVERAASHASSSTSGQEQQQQQREFVRYWLHNGFVNVDSEKMSKSLGNFFTIRDVLKQYHALALRWFLVSTHYRAPVNYSSRALDEASDRLYYVCQALLDAHAALAAAGAPGEQAVAQAAKEQASGSGAGADVAKAALTALLDDLNTPAALSELSAPLKLVNDLLTTKAGRKQADRLVVLARAQQGISAALALLGLLPPAVDGGAHAASAQPAGAAATPSPASLEALLAELRRLALVRAGLTEAHVAAKIEARAAARGAKDFAAADAIRVELAAQGVAIMDTPQGTTWRPMLAAQPAAAAAPVPAAAGSQ